MALGAGDVYGADVEYDEGGFPVKPNSYVRTLEGEDPVKVVKIGDGALARLKFQAPLILDSQGNLTVDMSDVMRLAGYISASDPSGKPNISPRIGFLWLNASVSGEGGVNGLPIPFSPVRSWNGLSWLPAPDYHPKDFDLWYNFGDASSYYWLGGRWHINGFSIQLGALTIAKNGIAQGTYNPTNGSQTIDIEVPAPPAVNNGTLTIQKNGTNVATFSANQAGNQTANIEVPTTDATAPPALVSGGTGAAGSSALYARRDHSHTLPAYPSVPDISGKVSRSGDTMAGALNFANNTENLVGDDVSMGDGNQSGTLVVKGKNANGEILIKDQSHSFSNSDGFRVRASINNKLDKPSGAASQLVRGDGTLTPSGAIASTKQTWEATSSIASKAEVDYDNVLFKTTRTGSWRGYYFDLLTGNNNKEKLANGMVRVFAAEHTTSEVPDASLNWLSYWKAGMYFKPNEAVRSHSWKEAMTYLRYTNNVSYYGAGYASASLAFCFRNDWQNQYSNAPMWAPICA
jgi:hypothetical protein